MFKQGTQLSFGIFSEGPGTLGQAFVTIGIPKNMLFIDASASMQFLAGKSKSKPFDLSGKGQSYGAGYGPFSGSLSQGVDNQGNITNTVVGFGPGIGAKYTGGGANTKTWTMPIFIHFLITPVGLGF